MDFAYNRASTVVGRAGAIFSSGASAKIYLINDCYFLQNRAEFGGAIYVEGQVISPPKKHT